MKKALEYLHSQFHIVKGDLYLVTCFFKKQEIPLFFRLHVDGWPNYQTDPP